MGTPENPDFDYIVIGSGAGGGPVAVRLAQAGYVVGLIEAGQTPQQKWYEVPVLHAFASEHPDISWEFFVKHFEDETRSRKDRKYSPDKGGVFYPRAGTLGGCTQHHAMITVYPHNSDWQNIVNITGDASWAPDKMRGYFEKLERCKYAKDPVAERHGTKGWLTTTGLDWKLGLGDPDILKTVWESSKAAWKAGFGGVLPEAPQDPNAWRNPEFQGICFAPLATLEGRRAGTRQLIQDTVAVSPRNLIVKQSNLAAKILFDAGKRAIGVECWEGQHLYRADPNASSATPVVNQYYCRREVIVAGGAFNSPQLLMLSGIGPAADLKKLNIPVLADRQGVGKNLQDRYEIAVVSEMTRNWKVLASATFAPPLSSNETGDPCYVDWQNGKGVYTTNGSLVAVIRKSKPEVPDPDLFMFAVAGKFQGYYPGYSKEVSRTKNFLTWLVLKAHTKNTAGYVRLRTADPRDRPEINFRYFDDAKTAEGDLDALVTGVEFVRTIARHNSSIKSEVIPGKEKSGPALREFIADNAWGHHASCTNAMGTPDDPKAVVDSSFRVIGVQNLRVVDASVFPRIPGFFIVTPIYMIAEKAADVILADAKRTGGA
ncbi:MAG TPA: GMC family oxidoreductase [Thermoanaerobaculia bacterium]|nr:GMC family oxidoreductase [Thermoanaerobaculia bacterium]